MSATIDRVLGPHLGSRLGDGLQGTREARIGLEAEIRNLATGFFLGAGSLGTTSVLITTYFADDVPGYRPVLVVATTLAALATSALVPVLWGSVGPRPWLMHSLLLGSTLLASFGSWASGPVFAPFGMIFYIWTAIAAACFFHRAALVAHVIAIGIGAAIVLSILEPSASPVARWLLIVGTCGFSCLLVDRFNTQLQQVAFEEAVARDRAEEISVRLEEASRHKSDFLASMSHELRTPLNAVIGFSDVLLSRHFGELNDDQAEYVGDIADSGRHLLALINDVLDLSKVEAGRMEISPSWFHLGECIRSSCNLVQVRAEEAGVTLVVEVAEPEIEAHGDERRIKQVLVNLLNNAVKFTPTGGTVSVRAWRDELGIRVAVADTGVGIADDDQERVFEDFRQVGSAELAKEGTGLGLALAKRFLELHGGTIRLESTLGVGSTFTCELPDPVGAPAPASMSERR